MLWCIKLCVCALEILVFLLETHCSRHHRCTGATNLFFTTWYGKLLAENNFSTKIGTGLG